MLYESQILNHPTSNPDEDTHTIALINPWKFSEFSHVRALLLFDFSVRGPELWFMTPESSYL